MWCPRPARARAQRGRTRRRVRREALCRRCRRLWHRSLGRRAGRGSRPLARARNAVVAAAPFPSLVAAVVADRLHPVHRRRDIRRARRTGGGAGGRTFGSAARIADLPRPVVIPAVTAGLRIERRAPRTGYAICTGAMQRPASAWRRGRRGAQPPAGPSGGPRSYAAGAHGPGTARPGRREHVRVPSSRSRPRRPSGLTLEPPSSGRRPLRPRGAARAATRRAWIEDVPAATASIAACLVATSREGRSGDAHDGIEFSVAVAREPMAPTALVAEVPPPGRRAARLQAPATCCAGRASSRAVEVWSVKKSPYASLESEGADGTAMITASAPAASCSPLDEARALGRLSRPPAYFQRAISGTAPSRTRPRLWWLACTRSSPAGPAYMLAAKVSFLEPRRR